MPDLRTKSYLTLDSVYNLQITNKQIVVFKKLID